jgi:DNA-binding XRE family transcriptional regulator
MPSEKSAANQALGGVSGLMPSKKSADGSTAQQRTQLIALGNVVRWMREERDLSGEALAEAAGVAHWRITAIEEGRLDPDFELLLRLADAMGARCAEFFMRAEEAGGDLRADAAFMRRLR